jgi:hypothetical protein
MRPLRFVLLVAVLVYLASVASALGAFTSDGASSPTASEYAYGKVTLCHRTMRKKVPVFETIVVDSSAVEMHLSHGDTLGPCTR